MSRSRNPNQYLYLENAYLWNGYVLVSVPKHIIISKSFPHAERFEEQPQFNQPFQSQLHRNLLLQQAGKPHPSPQEKSAPTANQRSQEEKHTRTANSGSQIYTFDESGQPGQYDFLANFKAKLKGKFT